jgi:hypothetical protein
MENKELENKDPVARPHHADDVPEGLHDGVGHVTLIWCDCPHLMLEGLPGKRYIALAVDDDRSPKSVPYIVVPISDEAELGFLRGTVSLGDMIEAVGHVFRTDDNLMTFLRVPNDEVPAHHFGLNHITGTSDLIDLEAVNGKRALSPAAN